MEILEGGEISGEMWKEAAEKIEEEPWDLDDLDESDSSSSSPSWPPLRHVTDSPPKSETP